MDRAGSAAPRTNRAAGSGAAGRASGPPNDTVNGEAVIGGYAYHGNTVPQLDGRYVFGGYSHEADEGIPSGRLFIINGNARPSRSVTIVRVNDACDFPLYVLGFGTSADGEL